MKKQICHLIISTCLALMPSLGVASEEGIMLDKAPIDIHDTESLQRGAQIFLNYCLSCHSAVSMRYNRLTDIGLTEQQIKDNLILTADKVGDPMRIAMEAKDAKNWFGNSPPDLSVVARSRGADWLYTYLRSFYRDTSRPTGWNNLTFDKVAMPHVLWQWQGEQIVKTVKGADGKEHHKLQLVKAGTFTRLENGKANTVEFDRRIADLTNFLVFMGEPAQVTRYQIGYLVLIFLLLLLFPLAYFLKKEFWKDIH